MLGQRYGLLPSDVLERATTFDLEVLDISLNYEKYKKDRAEGKVPELSQEEMLEALRKIK